MSIDGYHGPLKEEAEEFNYKFAEPEYAVEAFVEQNYCELEYPSECEVTVWDESDNKTFWTVSAEPTTTFSAREIS